MFTVGTMIPISISFNVFSHGYHGYSVSVGALVAQFRSSSHFYCPLEGIKIFECREASNVITQRTKFHYSPLSGSGIDTSGQTHRRTDPRRRARHKLQFKLDTYSPFAETRKSS
jgi:hypothetical protein